MISPRWRKSSYSEQGTDCVEVADSSDMIRDSKNPAEVLPLNRRAVAALIRTVSCPAS
jgi:hypothetical protein